MQASWSVASLRIEDIRFWQTIIRDVTTYCRGATIFSAVESQEGACKPCNNRGQVAVPSS